jgi:quinohemoprotein amine dehydrogenase
MPLSFRITVFGLAFAGIVAAQSAKAPTEEGIPVSDALVIAKCGSCHTRDERGNMQGISWARATPEAWQAALKRMILLNGLSVTAPEARSIVKYLSAGHGLAPEEAKPVLYDAERRIHDEERGLNDDPRVACSKCHPLSRALSWRRSLEDWKQIADLHAKRYEVPFGDPAIAFLAKEAPLHTPEWDAWSARKHSPGLTGRWLLTASLAGHGQYYGEMLVDPAGDEELNTSVRLTSVADGSSIVRSGRGLVFAAYSWRGRSKGDGASSAPDDPLSDAREALVFASDQSAGEGRWFWGQYQEFGFDVKLWRPSSSDPTLMLVDRSSLKTGSQANRIRLIGDRIPVRVTPADLDFGPGVSVRRIVSSTPNDVIAEVDVALDAPLGKRDVAIRHSVSKGAIAIYDRVDYVKVTPDSSMAAFGDQAHGRGYQQFEAIGYQRGADGKPHTADDVELGPVDVIWSLEVFYAAAGSSSDFVGKLSPAGLFTPADDSPNNNFDVWAIATAKNELGKNGKPLVGKSYLVVTVPTYTFNGRKFIRDLNRWVDDGPAQSR